MSRAFEVIVRIKLDKLVKHKKAVKAALSSIYDFEWECVDSFTTEMVGTCALSIGFTGSEEEVARDLAKEAFKANDGPLNILTRTTCLEDLPYEEFEYGKEAYNAFKQAGLLDES